MNVTAHQLLGGKQSSAGGGGGGDSGGGGGGGGRGAGSNPIPNPITTVHIPTSPIPNPALNPTCLMSSW